MYSRILCFGYAKGTAVIEGNSGELTFTRLETVPFCPREEVKSFVKRNSPPFSNTPPGSSKIEEW